MKTNDIRRKAVEIHSRDADIFAGRYRQEPNRFGSAFFYGRARIDERLEAALATLRPGARILDLGCGTGDLILELRRRGFDAVGVEPSQAMRDQARAILPEDAVVDGSVVDIPHDANSFDMVISIEVFRYLDAGDNERGLREVLRVLKSGGVFFGTFVNLAALDGFQVLVGLRHLRALLRGGETEFHTEFELPTLLERKLQRVGFDDVIARGAMLAPLRIAYKISPAAAARFAAAVAPADDLLTSSAGRALAGHLILTARRP